MPAINLWTSLSGETTSCLTQSGRDDHHSRAIYLIWGVPYCAREQFSWGSNCLENALGVLDLDAGRISLVEQPLRRSLQEKSDGEEDCKLELLVRNRLFGDHSGLEGHDHGRNREGTKPSKPCAR